MNRRGGEKPFLPQAKNYNKMNKLLVSLALAATVVACVPAKKYNDANAEAARFREQAEDCKVNTNQLKKRIDQLESDIAKFEKEKHSLEQDTTLYGMKNRTLLNTLAILENDLRLLAAKLGDNPEYKALMKHLLQMQDKFTASEGKRIDVEKAIAEQEKELAATEQALADSERALEANYQALADKDTELANKDAALADRDAALASKDAELASAQRSIEEQAARLREMEAALHAQEQAMAELRNTIARALTDFSSDELTVHQKDGKVYVSLEEQLLFASGRYDVNDKGASALKKIASVLASQTELDIVVEGHTDNVPYHGQVLIDNWDLSVKRATSVLRILIADGKIAKNRIEATGRADSEPIDAANTPEARRKNRRTEIILAPNLDKIMNMLGE